MTKPLPEAAAPYRIGVISDTHGRLAGRVFEVFEGVALILHAGDIGSDDVLTALEALAPVSAVRGNVDGFTLLGHYPLTRELETPAGRIALTHGHLPNAPSTNPTKMIAHFAKFQPEIIVFGHSHIPCHEEIAGVTLFNPGSASQSRWGRSNTVGMITVEPGGNVNFAHVDVG